MIDLRSRGQHGEAPMQAGAVVIGVGESEYYVRGKSPTSEFQLACTAIRRAVEDAGLALADVDGIVSYMDHATTRCAWRRPSV